MKAKALPSLCLQSLGTTQSPSSKPISTCLGCQGTGSRVQAQTTGSGFTRNACSNSGTPGVAASRAAHHCKQTAEFHRRGDKGSSRAPLWRCPRGTLPEHRTLGATPLPNCDSAAPAKGRNLMHVGSLCSGESNVAGQGPSF